MICIRLLACLTLLAPTLVWAQGQQPQATSAQAPGMKVLQSPEGRPFGVILDEGIWPYVQIPVCLENPAAAPAKELRWIRDALAKSWEQHSKIEFSGWQPCQGQNKGIRLLIDDSGPRTLGLGRQIDGLRNGMLLNFTFQNWGLSCAADTMRELCIRSIAVHEFGHALGFAHEQNRADTPGECTQKPQGESGDRVLTPWDPSSVMNYCNPVYNNNGILSALDIKAVQEIYGAK